MRASPCLFLAALLLSAAQAWADPYAFVSGAADNSIGVVDLADDTLAGSFALPGLPSGVAMSSDRTHLYVAQSQLGSLAVIDTATGGVVSIPVGVAPAGVAAMGNRLVYVANTSDDTLSAVDAVAGTVLATIPVAEAPVALVAGGRRVYAANWNQGTVSVISASTHTVVGSVPVGRFPAGMALNPSAHRLYVANFFDDTVSVVDTQALAVLATIPVGRRPRGLALDASSGRLYVGGFEDGVIDVVDTATNSVLFQAPSGGQNPMDLFLGPGHERLYAVHLDVGSNVRVLDAASLAPLGSIDGPAGPVAIAGLGSHTPPFASMRGAFGWAAERLLHRSGAGAVPARTPVRGPTATTEVSYFDGTFDIADWHVTTQGETSTSQQATGGNPGFWRRTSHLSPATSVHELVKPGMSYEPASQGPIQTIDFSWDRRLLTESIGQEGALVTQNDVVYRTEEHSFFFQPAWESESRSGLVAADFDDGNGGHPDFTSAGSPIRFGYFRRTPFSPVVHGIDNFLVTVFAGPQVPAGSLGFKQTVLTVQDNDTAYVHVARSGGTQGAVSVEMFIERPDGTTGTDTLTWADGDNAEQVLVVVFLDLPDGSGARTARLRLQNPTGGAVVQPSRGEMAILVIPDQWPPILTDLYLSFVGLLSGFTPSWLLVLAAAAALVAGRSWRARGRAGAA